jgi:hypothetical protein
MRDYLKKKIGIYIAYPTTSELKLIDAGLKTKVNNNHTKIGKTENGFAGREKNYMKTFDNEVEFYPIIIFEKKDDLRMAEDKIKSCLKGVYKRVGHAREWFDTDDRESVIKIITNSLMDLDISYSLIRD